MALWLFGIQICVVNAYVAYSAMCIQLYNMNKKKILTHYEFQKYLALVLIDEERWGPHSENWRNVLTKKGRAQRIQININQWKRQVRMRFKQHG